MTVLLNPFSRDESRGRTYLIGSAGLTPTEADHQLNFSVGKGFLVAHKWRGIELANGETSSIAGKVIGFFVVFYVPRLFNLPNSDGMGPLILLDEMSMSSEEGEGQKPGCKVK